MLVGANVWIGSAWSPFRNVQVWNGTSFVQAKSVRVWNGTSWALGWAPAIAVTASLAFSKVGVVTGEAYSVSLLAPGGFPAGTVVTFRFTGWTSGPMATTEGSTSVTLTGASHASAGDYAWYADVTIPGATDVTFGPATQGVTAVAPPPPVDPPPASVVTVSGGHCHDIQAGMSAAAAAGLPLRLAGTFHVYTSVYIPDNLYIDATGSMFYVNKHTDGSFNAGRFRNDPKGNAAGYGQAGGFTWVGGTLDGNGGGIFTISHSPGFTIQGATMYRYCSTAVNGHAIEVNSSGGADNVSGPFNVRILSNTFLGTDLGQRANSNDEPVQFDWNWGGSGASAPVWNPGDPVSESTQVMCHNVLIDGNVFHRVSESAPWEFAKCAIGGHDSADSAVVATYRHNHFQISNNVIHGARGSNGTNPDKGAIHIYRVRQASAIGNQFYGGAVNRIITAENSTDAGYCSASGNASYNPTVAGTNSIIVLNTETEGLPMTYSKTAWVNGSIGGTPMSAANLNKMEDGIEAAHLAIAVLEAADGLPAGSVMFANESSGTYVRPTARTDICVIFTGVVDPGATALEGDKWDRL